MIVKYPNDRKTPVALLIIVSVVSGILGGVIATFYFHFFSSPRYFRGSHIRDRRTCNLFS